MRSELTAAIAILVCGFVGRAIAAIPFPRETRLNNLVSDLLAVSSLSQSSQPLGFARSNDGWIFISTTCKGTGTVRVVLDQEIQRDIVIVHEGVGGSEAMRYVSKGGHTLRVEFSGKRFKVIADGKPLFDVEDSTFADAGKVGLWTKSDSVTLFDDFAFGSP